jgi:hypothetical protein
MIMITYNFFYRMHFPIFVFTIREADNNTSKAGDETQSIE